MLIINNQPKEIMAIVVLEASDEYLFVETGPDGEGEHLKPNLVAGEKQHMIVVKLHFETIVHLHSLQYYLHDSLKQNL